MAKILQAAVIVLGLAGISSVGTMIPQHDARPDFDEISSGVVAIFQGMGMGSGFFIEDNVIVTNYHVVRNAKALSIKTNNSDEIYAARIIAADAVSDIAMIEIINYADFNKNEDHSSLELLDSASAKVGEKVWAVGHPWGFFYSVSEGILSYKNRASDSPVNPAYYMQVDANVYSGNSGGPLIDAAGGVLGMNTWLYINDGGSIGFSISSDIIKRVVSDLKAFNEVRWARLNIGMKWNSEKHGIELDSVPEGSQAKIGDIIRMISVSGKSVIKISRVEQLRNQIALTHPGDDVKMVVERAGKNMELNMKTFATKAPIGSAQGR